jgi:23S rRNA pseudouridine1911/1915/1917 synthase
MLITLTPNPSAPNVSERLDALLARAVPEYSRSRLQKLIEEGCMTHNGVLLSDPSQKVRSEIEVEINLPPLVEAEPLPQNIPLDIVYEDNDLIVINKQAGLVVHPGNGNWEGTLVNALLYHCKDTLSGIGGVARPGIVHRLDKDTTGLMVVAKNDGAHAALSAQFAEHGKDGILKRAYYAFCWGEAPQKRKIETFLDRDTGNREKQAVRAKGRHAVTYVERRAFNGQVSLVECRLETGRTHQIRVHLSYVGNPLLGDKLYGNSHLTKVRKLSEEAQTALGALNRQALHAFELGFLHPTRDEEMFFTADLPPDLQALKNALFSPQK